jgi:hypothetical protein
MQKFTAIQNSQGKMVQKFLAIQNSPRKNSVKVYCDIKTPGKVAQKFAAIQNSPWENGLKVYPDRKFPGENYKKKVSHGTISLKHLMFKECPNVKTNKMIITEKTNNSNNPAIFYIFTTQNKLN